MSLEKNLNTYGEESKYLLKIKKDNLLEKLTNIKERLENSDTINEFLIKQINECIEEKEEPITIKNKCLIFFIIKIIGTLFVTLYLIGVFEIMIIMNAVFEEIVASIRLFFKNENDENRNIYYHNFINFAIKIPSFSPFYLSSLLSNIVINLFGFYLTTIFVIVVNILTIILGINNFEFAEESSIKYNYKYELKKFLRLVLIYLFFYISIGLVALVPLDIIQEGFKKYDQKQSNDLYKCYHHFVAKVYAQEHAENEGYGGDIEKYQEKLVEMKEIMHKKEEKMKDNILNKKNKDLDLYERVYSNLLLNYKIDINGFLLFYLISMTGSSIFVIIFNRIFLINYSEYNRNKKTIYYILSFSLPMIFALIFYKIYTLVFGEENTQNKKIEIIKFGGYIIYQEKYISNENCCSSLFSDCLESFEKLNYGCCCQLCSCTYICKSLICCKCSCDNNIRKRIATNDVNKEKICVIYKINGICSWLTHLLTNPRILIFVPILYIMKALNIQFSSKITEDSENNFKTITLNIITLSSRFIFFTINYFGGKALSDEKKDFYIFIYGIIIILIFESIFSAIISIFINFDLISGNLRDYLITISVESTEYMEIVCLEYFSLYFQMNLALGDFLSNSFILTFYLSIWNLFELIITTITKEKYLYIFQFVFGIILSITSIIITFCIRFNSNTNYNLSNLIDNFDV